MIYGTRGPVAAFFHAMRMFALFVSPCPPENGEERGSGVSPLVRMSPTLQLPARPYGREYYEAKDNKAS